MAISWTIKLAVGVLIGLLVGVGGGYYAGINLAPTTTTTQTTIVAKIGCVVPLTGDLASIGTDNQKCATIGIQDVNAFMNLSGQPYQFQLVTEDAKDTGPDALTAIQTLVTTQGVKTIIGLILSTQIGACQSYLDSNKILAMCLGTSPLYANRTQDYIWRPTGTDAQQADGLAHLAVLKNYTKVVGLVHDDSWGHGVWGSFDQFFTALGGHDQAIFITPGLTDYAAQVSALSSLVTSFGAQAVLCITFGETTNVIGHAISDPVLSHVDWLATNQMQDPSYIPPLASASIPDFFISRGMVGTTYLNPVNAKALTFYDEYQAKYGTRTIYPSALQLYDAVWLIALGTVMSGKYDSDAIIKELPILGSTYVGITGPKTFDSHGDSVSNWSIWQFVKNSATSYSYENIGYFDSGSREVVMKAPPSIT